MWSCPDVPFEWDETKRLSNLEKHGIDFVDAVRIFDEPIVETPSTSPGEERWKVVGPCDDVLIAVVCTFRDGRCRIISARRAHRNERAQYHAYHPP